MNKILCGDFETTIGDQHLEPKNRETEVWLSCFCAVSDLENRETYKIQTNIKDFFIQLVDYCNDFYQSNKVDTFICFFHNLKFDGSFMINYFINNDLPYESFISDMGQWYSITIHLPEYDIVFRDSLKVMAFTLRKIAKDFNFPTPKGETPLLEFPPDSILPEWIEYIKTDVEILARAMKLLYFDGGITKYTSASEALSKFKETVNFRELFPILDYETDSYLRKAYRGGWSFVNPLYKNKEINLPIEVYDINSMYPSKMLKYPMPYGKPKFIEGSPIRDYYFIARVMLCLELKPNHLPTLQIKSRKVCLELGIKSTDYITTTYGKFYEVTLTNFDLELIYNHYDYEIEFLDHYAFKAKIGIFDEYVNKWKEVKEHAKNGSIERYLAKLYQNSLYGKFGSRTEEQQKIPYLKDGRLAFELSEPEQVKPNYIAVACFITSISRRDIITDAQNNYYRFLYSDTDSLHMISDKYSSGDIQGEIKLPIHGSEYGYYKLEKVASRGKYLRSKLYIEETENGVDVVGAGMTDEIKAQVNFDNFHFGSVFEGKRATKQVKGGMIIYNTTFEIKESVYNLF